MILENLIHKIGLGTVQFGLDYGISNQQGKPNLEEVKRILKTAAEVGIEVLDTAAVYGDSESVLGTCLADFDFKIITKFMGSKTPMDLRQQLEGSLGRLKCEQVYGYMAHRPIELVEYNELWGTLQELKNEGIVQKVGYSLNTLEEYNEMENLHKEHGYPDLVQVPFNYFDSRFVDVMKQLRSKGCEIHARSAFLQGLFFMDPDELSEHFNEVKGDIQLLQNQYGSSLPRVLLKHALVKEFIDRVVIGVQNAEQLSGNIAEVQASPEMEPLNKQFGEEVIVPSNWNK